jgi:hypothetical protein
MTLWMSESETRTKDKEKEAWEEAEVMEEMITDDNFKQCLSKTYVFTYSSL